MHWLIWSNVEGKDEIMSTEFEDQLTPFSRWQQGGTGQIMDALPLSNRSITKQDPLSFTRNRENSWLRFYFLDLIILYDVTVCTPFRFIIFNLDREMESFQMKMVIFWARPLLESASHRSCSTHPQPNLPWI